MDGFLDESDYNLFIIQVQDYVFDAIDDLIDWSVLGAPGRVKTMMQKAIDMAWRVGITVEEWEDSAAQLAQQLFDPSAKASRGIAEMHIAARASTPLRKRRGAAL